ncbi:DUF4388 domain-containing protein [Deferrisoma sp.]
MELRGTLRDFSLADIIQLVAFGQKTGVLRVVWPEGRASIYFEGGAVVHAEAPGCAGEEAVYRMFRIADGEFQFQNSDVPPPARTIAVDPTNLVMEAARLLDESGRSNGAPPEGEAAEGDGEEMLGDFGDISFDLPGEQTGGEPDPAAAKGQIRDLLRRRFGRRAKRMIEAVDRCGESKEDLLDLADRVEKYVRVFLDEAAAPAVGEEIRRLVDGGRGGSVS